MRAEGLAATEELLLEALDGVPASLREPCRRIALAGGRRLRAGLVLTVAGRAWPGTSRRTATAAAAVELLHLATLVHEDLLDDAPVRRGVPTVNAKEGAGVALLAGDLLIGLATRLAAATGAGPLLGTALAEVCAGRALEADNRFHADVSEATALRVAELKTGTLLAAACRLGAIVTGTPEDGLAEYGTAFGTALHLLDDVLDLVSDEATYGRPTGVDFAAGAVTLPGVHGLATSADLRRLLRPGLDDEQRERANDLLRAEIPATWVRAGDLVEAAAAARPDLAELPRRYRDSRLALVLPRYRSLLSS